VTEIAGFTEEEVRRVQEQYKDIQNGPLSPTQATVLLTRCRAANADPLAGHIIPQLRKSQDDNDRWVTRMALVTSIDFLRLVADRTGEYSPGAATQFGPEAGQGGPEWAKSFVRKFAKGVWHEYSSQAFFREYVQLTRAGKVSSMWAKMPYGMLEKCAEAKALRRGFPNELQGLYSHEEMQQADSGIDSTESAKFFGDVPRKVGDGEGQQGGGQESDPPPPVLKTGTIVPKTSTETPKPKQTDFPHGHNAPNSDAVAVSLPVGEELSSGVSNPPPEVSAPVKTPPIDIIPLATPPVTPQGNNLPKKDTAISQAQLTRLVTIQQSCKVSDSELAAFLKTVKTTDYPDGLISRRQIPKNVYDIVVGYVKGKKK
jgi:phage recombination protein Bet